MSLKPQPPAPLSETMAQLGAALLPQESPYRLVGETLFMQYQDTHFADLYACEGKPALSPVRLAFVLIFQALENLSDRAAAAAVRVRIDWKYALHLPLDDPGFDASVLCEFRARLLAHDAEARLFEGMLAQCKTLGLLTARGIQRTDSLAVLSRARHLGRSELVFEAICITLRALQHADAAWLTAHLPAPWAARYQHHCCYERWSAEERTRMEQTLGADGQQLLHMLDTDAPDTLRDLPAVTVLRTIWQQQFVETDGQIHFREPKETSGKDRMLTPYDPEAQWSKKRDTSWIGYKLQVSESDDPDQPHLITDIAVTEATLADQPALEAIAERQTARAILPRERYVDRGYMGGPGLVAADQRHEDLIGPAPKDQSPQALRPDGMSLKDFQIDLAKRTAICPQDHAGTPKTFVGERDSGDKGIIFTFKRNDCHGCPLQKRCVTGKGQRFLTVRETYDRLQQARTHEQTETFKQAYAQHRSPVEGCLSALVRGQGIRTCRYIGKAKNHLRALLIGTAVNLARAAAWLAGTRHRPKRQGLQLGLAKT